MKITNSNLTINVRDLDRSISFYETLGFGLTQRWENHYAQLQGPGLLIGLHPTDLDKLRENSGNLSIGFTTDDFDRCKTALNQAGIEMQERVEEGGRFIHFKDPDGTYLYFIDPKKWD